MSNDPVWVVRVVREQRMGTIVHVMESRTGIVRVAVEVGDVEEAIERCKRSILERMAELGLSGGSSSGESGR